MSDEEADESGGEPGGRPDVPYARFSKVVDAKNTARADLAAARAELDAAKAQAATVASVTAERDRLLALTDSLRSEHADSIAMFRAGLDDDEGQAVARTLHGRLPEAERPALSEWLAGLRAAGAEVPRSLAPYLAPSAPVAPAKPKPAAPKTQQPPNGGKPEGAAVREAREKLRLTGDPSDLRRALGLS